MYHCETFDMYLDSRHLQKRTFRDRGFGCKVLMARHYRGKAEGRRQKGECGSLNVSRDSRNSQTHKS